MKRKVLRGVQRSKYCSIVGAAIASVRLECRGLPKPSQQDVRDSQALRVLGRGRICAGCCVHPSLLLQPGTLHDADSPVLLGRVWLIFFSLSSLFDDTRPFLWIQLFAVHPADRFGERRILSSPLGAELGRGTRRAGCLPPSSSTALLGTAGPLAGDRLAMHSQVELAFA